MKAKLRSLKIGDLSIDAYFCKLGSIGTILNSLRSSISNDDVVTLALEGFLDKYENVSTIIVHQNLFPDIKMVRFMLTTKDMQLKSRAQTTSIVSTSFSPMVLLANSGNSSRCPNVALEKVNKPCFNFNKGFYRFGDHCKFIHKGTSNKVIANNSLWSISNVCPTSSSVTNPNMIQEQIMALTQTQQALLTQFWYHGNNGFGTNATVSTPIVSNGTIRPISLYTTTGPA
ncbi:hybrid signal transduction histidine kinase M [Tanacetum coccineum]